MNKYRPVDAVYEDIYDFDDIKYDIQLDFNVHYTDITEGNVPIPNCNSDKVSLPSITGINKYERTQRTKPVLDYGSEKTKNKVVNLDVERKSYTPKHTEKIPEYANIWSSVTKLTHLPSMNKREHRAGEHLQHVGEPVDHEEIYRSLMAAVPDKSLLEKSPQVIEYERRNKVHRLLAREQMPLAWVSKELSPGHNLMKSEADDFTLHAAKTHHNARLLPDIHQKHLQHKPVHHPLPPVAPKSENSSFTRNRRKYPRTASQIEKDNQRVLQHVPRPLVAKMEIDHEKKVNEIIRVQRGFALHDKVIAEKKKATTIYDMQDSRPPSAATSSSDHTEPSTQSHIIPVAGHCKASSEPLKTRNGDTVIFRSREKKQKQEPTKLDVGRMPEKIKKRMNKYFG